VLVLHSLLHADVQAHTATLWCRRPLPLLCLGELWVCSRQGLFKYDSVTLLSKGPSCKEGKRNTRDYLWIVHKGVWAQFHAQRKHMIFSRKPVRFATPVMTNFHPCSRKSSTPSLEQFQSTNTSFITLQQHAAEAGNGLETFVLSGLVAWNPGLSAQQLKRFLILPLASQNNLPKCLRFFISVDRHTYPTSVKCFDFHS